MKKYILPTIAGYLILNNLFSIALTKMELIKLRKEHEQLKKRTIYIDSVLETMVLDDNVEGLVTQCTKNHLGKLANDLKFERIMEDNL